VEVPGTGLRGEGALPYDEEMRNRVIFQVLVVTFILLLSPRSQAESCKFSLDPSSLKVEWTAFKTTQKLGVNGAFPGVSLVKGVKEQRTLQKLLSSVSGEIRLEGASGIQTGNPGRDQTLFDRFFKHWKGAGLMKGRFKKIEGSGKDGTLELELSINGLKKALPLQWKLAEDGAFEAGGKMDVLEFGLKSAFDDLHKACEALHTGPDGISKTWSEVELRLKGVIARKCAP
jgi:hypothetical protein